MNEKNYSTIYVCLADVLDQRKVKGQRYGWCYLLTLVVIALLAGQWTLIEMSVWLHEEQACLVIECYVQCTKSDAFTLIRAVQNDARQRIS